MGSIKKRTLTEAEWARVFRIQCKTKQGQAVTDEDNELIKAAFSSDQKRYGDMADDVFNATVPFGSNVRREKK